VEAEHRQHHDRDRLHRLAGSYDGAAVIAVGDMARHQHQRQRGKELHQADQTEIECTAGQGIDLPADGDRQHLIRHRCGDAREPEVRERTVAKR